MKKSTSIIVTFLILFFVLITFEAKAGWRFWKEETCQSMIDPIINRPLVLTLLTKNGDDMDYIKEKCYQLILKDGDYKELYAYYQLYKYADKALKGARKGRDETANNIYHYMLFYANQNSRDFDHKTKSFKKEQGIYEQELKDFEDAMTQEEKIKAFSYIADNLATGKEGWVKVNDYKKSFEYLKKAAEAGDYSSQGALGIRYFLGSDRYNKFTFEKNYIEGYKWIYLSTLHSTQDEYYRELSLKSFRILERKITSQQISDAENLSKIWLKENSEFIKNHPLKIIPITEEEIAIERDKTKKLIKDYELDKPLLNNNINQTN